MKITHYPATLWYETKNGTKLYLTEKDFENGYYVPKGARYQVSRFPSVIRTSYLYLKPDGGSEEIFSSNSSFPEDLVLKMANEGYFSLGQSMIICSEACERCMNVLAYNYGLNWGYPLHSKKWKKSHTSCKYCKDEWIYDIWWNIKLCVRNLLKLKRNI